MKHISTEVYFIIDFQRGMEILVLADPRVHRLLARQVASLAEGVQRVPFGEPVEDEPDHVRGALLRLAHQRSPLEVRGRERC